MTDPEKPKLLIVEDDEGLLRQIADFSRRFTFVVLTGAVILFAFAVLVRGFDWTEALIAVVALAVGGGPIGVFLMLRRMSLTGDAMAHAILPGAALGYLVAGFSLPAMTIGGLAAGFAVALAAGAAVMFAVTPMRPVAPIAMCGRALASSPEKYIRSVWFSTRLTSLKSPLASLIARMFGCLARRRIVS